MERLTTTRSLPMYDGVPNYSDGVTASATPYQILPPPPPDVTGFTATAGDGQVQLSWTNPTDPDFAGVVLVYRTDTYPTSPTDGTEIYNGTGTNFTHTGLTNGTTYYYTIFTYDNVPNYSNGIQASATPSGPKTWITVAPMPTARSGHKCVYLNGYVYAIGGSNYYTSQNERYDPVTDSWNVLTKPIKNIGYFAIGVINGKIYVAGGFSFTSPSGGVETNALQEYDPLTDTWAYKASMPTTRSTPAYGVIDNKLYVVGGETPGDGTTSVLEIYDPSSDSWTTGAPLPEPRRSVSGAVVNGKLYVIGGDQSDVIKNSVYAYDPATNNWSNLAPIPEPINNAVSIAYNNQIFIIGGNSTTGAKDTVNTSNDTWSLSTDPPNLPNALGNAGGCVILPDTLFVTGGWDTNNVNTSYIYKMQ